MVQESTNLLGVVEACHNCQMVWVEELGHCSQKRGRRIPQQPVGGGGAPPPDGNGNGNGDSNGNGRSGRPPPPRGNGSDDGDNDGDGWWR